MGKRTNGQKGWQKWTPEQAGRELRAWKTSGLPLEAFARQRGLSGQRLRWWRDRLNDWTPPAGEEPVLLAPAVLTDTAVTVTAPVMVRLPGGAVLEMTDATGVPPAWLVAVVGGLSRAG